MNGDAEAVAARQVLEDAYAARAEAMLAEPVPEEQPWWLVGLSIILVYAALSDEDTGSTRTPAAALALLMPQIRVKATQDFAREQLALAASSGAGYVRWVATPDVRTRASHRALDGTSQPLGRPFHTIWGASLMFPGDTSAPPDEWMRCRCVLVPSRGLRR